MNLPSLSNSSSWVAAAAYAGPVVLPRDSAKTCPLELTATPETSPKYMLVGSFSGLGTDSKLIVGTACCANACDPTNNGKTKSQRLMNASRMFSLARTLINSARSVHLIAQVRRHIGKSFHAWRVSCGEIC